MKREYVRGVRPMTKVLRISEAMSKNNFDVKICKNKEEAMQHILSSVSKDKTIACVESHMLEEMKIVKRLRAEQYQCLEWNKKVPVEKKCEQLAQLAQCDVLLTDVHAVCKNGALVLSEKTGSRIAAMTFGADEVIVIAAANKVYRNEKSAMKHARRIAGFSNYMIIVNGCMIPGRIKVILVTEQKK